MSRWRTTASAFAEEGAAKIVYTSKLTEDDLADLRGVSTMAHLFQRWVGPKAFEARVTVVGQVLLAAAIHARSAEATAGLPISDTLADLLTKGRS